MRSKIQIIDYGMGNLRSVQKAIQSLGYDASITSLPDDVASAEKLILPGVGAFGDAMRRLRELNLVQPLLDHFRQGKPFLGICLGLQLLFEKSYENGEHQGLGILAGEVVSFSPNRGIKVPHMGWNALHMTKRCRLLHNIPEGSFVYFVHSYYAVPVDSQIVCATTDYPVPITAAVSIDHLVATQFHPEKSQRIGLAILRNFVELY